MFALEICAFNLPSCIVAEQAGATRVELCADPLQGGTTPSWGLIKMARKKCKLQLYPIIRPREGDFCYDEDEFEIIKRDIDICKKAGCDGISVGVQMADGSIDTEAMKRVVDWAHPMGVTCNRVFDTVPDPFKALEDIISCGCERVLTSGGKKYAHEAFEQLSKLVQIAGKRISIMPGGGIRSTNINALLATGAFEFHSSARLSPSPSWVPAPHISPGELYVANAAEILTMVSILS